MELYGGHFRFILEQTDPSSNTPIFGGVDGEIHDFHDLEVLEIELRHPNSHVDNWCHVIIRVINLLVGCSI